MQNKIISLKLIKKLISFNSVSDKSNLDLIKYISDYLKTYKVGHIVQYNSNKSKANILATIGPIKNRGFIFAGHTDVVPVDDQIWNKNPFITWIKNNRLYGRGTSDMKSFIGIILALVPYMNQLCIQTPIHIFLTYDEEIGCHGAKQLIEKFKKIDLPDPLACIVGEPTEMQVVNGQKGVHLLKTIVLGESGHSSNPDIGSNALTIMSKIILFLDNLAEEFKEDKLSHNKNFNIPYNTINPAILKAGSAINIIPKKSELLWEYRFTQQPEKSTILDKLESYSAKIQLEQNRLNKECSIKTEEIAFIPSLETASNHKLTKFMLEQTDTDNALHVNFGTEAGLYQNCIGVPTIICGPGSIEQAHKANEYIELSQILLAEIIFRKIITTIQQGQQF